MIGGDKRLYYAACELALRGHGITAFNGDAAEQNEHIRIARTLAECVKRADAVALGTPSFTDGNYINGTGDNCAVSVRALLRAMQENAARDRTPLLLAAMPTDDIISEAKRYGIKVADYLANESYALNCAYSTAEGALEIMMRELPVTVRGSSAAIFGFGRIGRALCRMLIALGANVTVCARSPAALTEARLYGATTHGISGDMGDISCDILFNTIPCPLLAEGELEHFRQGTLLIELASLPGGIDRDAANRLGMRLIIARGLPGKASPVSAGHDLACAICDICTDGEVYLS